MAGCEWGEEANKDYPPAPVTLVVEASVTPSTLSPCRRRAWRSSEMLPLLGGPKHPSLYRPYPQLSQALADQSHRVPETHQASVRPGLDTLRSGYNGDGEGRRLRESSCCSAHLGLLAGGESWVSDFSKYIRKPDFDGKQPIFPKSVG